MAARAEIHSRTSEIARGRYLRFDVLARIEHLILLVSFTLLAVTGLPQKFASWPVSESIIKALGGMAVLVLLDAIRRLINRLAGKEA